MTEQLTHTRTVAGLSKYLRGVGSQHEETLSESTQCPGGYW